MRHTYDHTNLGIAVLPASPAMRRYRVTRHRPDDAVTRVHVGWRQSVALQVELLSKGATLLQQVDVVRAEGPRETLDPHLTFSPRKGPR